MRPMKDSGIDWLGEIPADWEVSKVAYLSRRSKTHARDLGVVTAFRDGQVTLRSNRRVEGFTEATEYHGYQLIKPGQLAVHRMDAFAGAIGVSDSEGMCSPVLTILDCSSGMNPWFLALYLREVARAGWIEALAKSVRERTSEFGWSQLSALFVAIPSNEEQAAIVSYLDQETSKIDLLISKKEQLIEKLLERRQALITQVVTKGLDPDVPMKESGVKWLGDVPIHWSLAQLGRILNGPVVDGPHETPIFEDEGLPFLSVDAIVDGELRELETRLISESDFNVFRRKALPEKDDILMGKSASIGKIARIKTDWKFAIWSPLALLKLNKRQVSPGFVEFALKSNFVQAQIEVLSNSNTQKNLSMGKIPSLMIAIPTLEEQKSISEHLAVETSQIDNLLNQIRAAIKLLIERRQALVTQVVTGKLDVRGFSDGHS